MHHPPRFDWHHAAAGLLALGFGALATAEEPLKPFRAAQALMQEAASLLDEAAPQG
jgi:hypothetical protein